MQSAIGMDRALPGRTTLSVNLIDTRGVHVLRERDINAYLPGTYRVREPASGPIRSTTTFIITKPAACSSRFS
jgi:hypothetical protein